MPSPDQILKTLEHLDVKISRKTFYNWEQWGLIPRALFKNSRTADFPVEAAAQAYASYFFVSGLNTPWGSFKLPVGVTRGVREYALRIKALYDEDVKKQGISGDRIPDYDYIQRRLMKLLKEDNVPIIAFPGGANNHGFASLLILYYLELMCDRFNVDLIFG